MAMRVATFALNDQMLSAALRTQAKVASQQIQMATGLVSTDYGGLGAKSKQLLDLQVSVARSEAYGEAATSAEGRATMMSSALSTMSDLITSFRADLIEASGVSASDDGVLQQTARQLLDEFATQLNTQYEGRYLFGGSLTDQLPVDVSAATYPAASLPSSADTSYYQGDAATTSVRVSDQQVIEYGITANDPAFEKVLRALNLIANAATIDADTLAEAESLTLDALDGVLAVQGKLSVDTASMQRAVDNQIEFQDFASSLGTDLNSVDVAALTAEMSAYTTQLEASYSAIAKIVNLNLFDYLK